MWVLMKAPKVLKEKVNETVKPLDVTIRKLSANTERKFPGE